MVDTITKDHRSWNMRQVRSKNTKPEIFVRSLLHKNGYRFRLHKKNMPGRPDIILSKYRTAIFVHGCFWHRHKGCADATTPKTHAEFWINKFAENVQRDKKNKAALKRGGWNVRVVWECEIQDQEALTQRLGRWLK